MRDTQWPRASEEKERLLAVYSSPERSMPAYGQNCTVQDNKGGGGLVSFVSQL